MGTCHFFIVMIFFWSIVVVLTLASKCLVYYILGCKRVRKLHPIIKRLIITCYCISLAVNTPVLTLVLI